MDGSTSSRDREAPLRPSRARTINPALVCVLAASLFAFVVASASAVSLRWILLHPGVTGWDQIQYIDLSLKDGLTRRLDGPGALRDALFNDYRWMPPGVRFLGLPLVLLHHDSNAAFRLLSLALFIVSILLVFDAGRRLSGIAAAAGAAALVAVAPIWVRASEEFMSETALVPALALALWCLVRTSEPRPPRYLPVLMGAALGFGMLAKFSFAPLAAVFLLMLGVQAWRRGSWTGLLVVLLVSALAAWPFYAYDGLRYVAYGHFAATVWPFDRMPGRGLAYARNYVSQLARSDFGLPALLLLPVAVALAVRGLLRGGEPAGGFGRHRFIATACGVMLMLTMLPHIFGHNQNARFLVAALPVLALFLAAGSGPMLGLAMSSVAAVQALVMLGLILSGPYQADGSDTVTGTTLLTNSFRLNPTCDFSGPIRAVRPLSVRPVVRFYGITGAINHLQIQAAFLRAGVLADVVAIDTLRPDYADPARSGADLVMVLDTPEPSSSQVEVADPDAGLGAIRDALQHSPNYARSDARVLGPAASCGMTSFLARRS
ncbi:ArnT family glycosyltransferase [Lichenicoccus sp.]|uniref:ArnT family glycosyltransferase n=1 Tax=Lichenicoccus sp. TaxID=2781899 RepID=UPI003D106E62